MPWMDGCPSDVAPTFGMLDPIAIVLHRTYGGWGGDYAVGKNEGLFQFLIGQDDGQWVQFADTNRVSYHCNGANFKAFGIELTGTNEDVLTDWQIGRLNAVLEWAQGVHGIPLAYQDPILTPPASIHVNDGGFRGVICHISVQTDDGSQQHTDLVTVRDYLKAVNGVPSPQPLPNIEEDDVLYMFDKDKTTILRMGSRKRRVTPPEWSAAQFSFKAITGKDLSPFAFDQVWHDSVPDEAAEAAGGGTPAPTKVVSTVTSVLG